MVDKDKLQVVHNPEHKRFEIQLDGGLAMVEYLLNKKNIIYTHTEVPVEYEGQGIGKILAEHVMNYAREQGLRVQPLCPFIKAYVIRHPEYHDISWGFDKK